MRGVRPEVVARDLELETIDGFLARLPSTGGLLAFEGEAGIGKSTLWEETVARARAAAFSVLTARPGETESKPAYGGLVDLFGFMPETSEAELAVLETLRRLAGRAPVLVAIDDLHWLDGPSRRVLIYALRRLERERIGFVVTERPPGTLLGVAPERLTRVGVGPLSLAALHRLVRLRLGVSLERPLLVRIARASGGNPFYALEIARALTPEEVASAPGTSIAIPRNLRAAVAQRLAALSAPAREAVLAVYSLARPTPELVERALELAGHPANGLALAAEADALEPGGGSVRLAHPLLGSVEYGRLAPSQRRALHGRLARLPLDPVEHAYHRALSAGEEDAEAAALAETAAAEASRIGAPETAAELLGLAIALTPGSDEAARLRRSRDAAAALFRSGDTMSASQRWREIADAAPPGPLRAEALWLLAEHGSATIAGGFDSVVELLEQASAEAASEAALRTRIEATLTEHLVWGRGPAVAQSHAEEALRLAEKSDDREALAHALASAALVDFLCGRGIDNRLLARAIRLEEDGLDTLIELLPSSTGAAMCVLSHNRLAEATAVLENRLADCRRVNDVASLAVVHWWMCSLAVDRGELAAAATHALACEEAVSASGRVGRQGLAFYCGGLVAAHHGDSEQALELGRRALALDESERRVVFLLGLHRGLLGFVEFSRGRFEQAVEWFEPARLTLLEQGYGEPGIYHFVPDEIEALIALGRADEAERLLVSFEDAAGRSQSPWGTASAARCRGLLLATRGNRAGALEPLRLAVAACEELDQPFELARALLAYGMVARRVRRQRDADEALQRATEIFAALGNFVWEERSRSEHARVRKPTAAGTLTETERRVAQLAAAGRRNKEIAAELFIGVRAVEANLTRVYTKLGIRSRAELAAKL